MFTALVSKELKSIILSPRFPAAFGVCAVLILLSVTMGIMEYNNQTRLYEEAQSLAEQEMLAQTSWSHLSTRVHREPDPMQVFVSGVDYDIGRWTNVSDEHSIKMRQSSYSTDTLFAVFRFVDFSFIVRFVLTLMALLFTYNAINGEREKGTLRLVLSNPVPRAKYIVAKITGAWLGLVVPAGIPILLSLLLILVFVPGFSGDAWFRLILLLGASLGLFTFFATVGTLLSAVTRRSSVSLMLSLVVWIVAVMLIPRAGVMTAGALVEVPRMAEIEAQRDAYANQTWNDFYHSSAVRWSDLDDHGEPLSDEEMWARMQAQDSAMKAVETSIDEYGQVLLDDLRRKKQIQEQLGFTLSRISPAAAYQLAAMNLSGTDIFAKNRYEEALTGYRTEFAKHTEKKHAESGDIGGVRISIEVDDSGFEDVAVQADRNSGELDLTGLPRFELPAAARYQPMGSVVVDMGIIVLGMLLAFAGAFVAFLRFDAR